MKSNEAGCVTPVWVCTTAKNTANEPPIICDSDLFGQTMGAFGWSISSIRL